MTPEYTYLSTHLRNQRDVHIAWTPLSNIFEQSLVDLFLLASQQRQGEHAVTAFRGFLERPSNDPISLGARKV